MNFDCVTFIVPYTLFVTEFLLFNIKKSSSILFTLITPNAQREWGKVISGGVHIYIYIYICLYVCGPQKNLNCTLAID